MTHNDVISVERFLLFDALALVTFYTDMFVSHMNNKIIKGLDHWYCCHCRLWEDYFLILHSSDGLSICAHLSNPVHLDRYTTPQTMIWGSHQTHIVGRFFLGHNIRHSTFRNQFVNVLEILIHLKSHSKFDNLICRLQIISKLGPEPLHQSSMAWNLRFKTCSTCWKKKKGIA